MERTPPLSKHLEFLPLELKEEILLHTSPEDLISFCRTSTEFYSICENISFWKERFRRDGLPLLEIGETSEEWFYIYRSLIICQGIVHAFLNTARTWGEGVLLTFYLESYAPAFIFTTPGLDEEVIKRIISRYNFRWKEEDLSDYIFGNDLPLSMANEIEKKFPLARDISYRTTLDVEVIKESNTLLYRFQGEERKINWLDLENLLYKFCYYGYLRRTSLFPTPEHYGF